MSTFLKSQDTKATTVNSKAALEKIVRRSGCQSFGTTSDYELGRITVFFRVPEHLDGDAPMIPVRLEVDIDHVFRRLQDSGIANSRKTREQAERVAWRHLVLWVDAACTAAAVGLRPISETFMADILTNTDQGPRRLAAVLNDDPNWKAALPSSTAQTAAPAISCGERRRDD